MDFFMDFKEQLKDEVKLNIKAEKDFERKMRLRGKRIRKWRKKNKEIRCSKDWEMIEKYLENLLMQKVKENKIESVVIFGTKYVERGIIDIA